MPTCGSPSDREAYRRLKRGFTGSNGKFPSRCHGRPRILYSNRDTRERETVQPRGMDRQVQTDQRSRPPDACGPMSGPSEPITGPLTGQADSFGFEEEAWIDPVAGHDLGGVTVVRLLAEGGMGRVFEGRQHAPSRPVAVKVLRTGLANRMMMKRFEQEAHLLARLRHPHIAQIYTLGTWHREGAEVPFFVMELVEGGLTIDQFATERRLTVRQRVAIVRQVAIAIAHGHRQGIVHRDLKPGNILVGGDGEPKVIDFGVAMSTDADHGLTTLQSDLGALVGTIRYMSPEQFDADTTRIGVATDVHALGLVLYELLTGSLPYDVRGKSVAVAARIIREQEPRTSLAFSRSIRCELGMDASQVRQLAAVVETCLQKRPADRYGTADALAAELARWLAGEPVHARPSTLTERSIRYVRRHPLQAAAAMLVNAAALAAAFFFSRANQQTRLAESHRAAERQEAYFSAVQRSAAAADRRNIGIAGNLLDRARSSAAIAGRPIELDCLAAMLDDSVATLRGHEAIVRAVAASPDGDRLVTGDDRGLVRLWSSDDLQGHEGWRMLARQPREGHGAAIWSAAVSGDGRRGVTASADGIAHIWNLVDGSRQGSLEGHAGAIYGCAITSDGRTVATASADGHIGLWDAAACLRHAIIMPPWRRGSRDRNVYGVAFTPRGDGLAAACGDGVIRVWKVEPKESIPEPFAKPDPRPPVELTGHTRRVFAVSFDAESRRLASASEDGTARVWHVETARCLTTLRHPLRVNGVAWTADGSALMTVSADAIVRLWDVTDGRLLREMVGHRDAIWSLASAADGRFVTASSDATARVWDVGVSSEPRLRCCSEDGAGVRAVTFSPDGRFAATATTQGLVRLWDRATYVRPLDLPGLDCRVHAVDFSPAGDVVAVACGDGLIRLHRVDDARETRRIVSHTGPVFSVAFAPDGAVIATAGSEPQTVGKEKGTVRLHAVMSGTAALATLPHPARVHGVAWSPDGRRLVTGCADGIVREWDPATAALLGSHSGHGDDVNWVAWSKISGRVASASSDGSVRIWNPSRGWSSVELHGPVGQVWETAFSTDGSRIAGVGADGCLHLWHAESGRHLLALDGHDGPLWSVAFSPDGRHVLTGSDDGTARVWGLSAMELLRRRSE